MPNIEHSAAATEETEEAEPDTVLIACAALGKEVRDIVDRHGWNVDVRVINARLHLYPKRIAPAVDDMLVETNNGYERQIVLYGQCGAVDLDEVLARHGAVRTMGPHCYEMYGGETFADAVRQVPGTFILTDFLIKAWDALAVKGLKIDKHPELKDMFFGNYQRVMYFSQIEDPELILEAERIAEWIGLPLEVTHTGYGDLEGRLVAIMNGEEQPTSSMTYDAYMPYPTAG